MTRDELEKRNIDLMGENLGKQYTALFHEVAALHLYWKEFIELFGTNDKRIERLNKAAPSFFRMLQEQQFESNILHLARLTDSTRSVGKPNLTVRSLPDLVSDPALKDQLLAHVDEVKRKTAFCRDWRNRRFAHHDLLLATGHAHARPLEAATKEKFAEALRAISDLLNVIERFYHRGICDFGAIAAHSGAATLLFILGFGVQGRERMQEKLAKGDFTAATDSPERI